MAFPNAPLQYPSLRILLQYIDPNQRILLVRKCPSLGAPDSKVPQRIESVFLEPSGIRINNTTYRMGVVSQWPQGAHVPVRYLEQNSNGGANYDVDRYGFVIPVQDVTRGTFPLLVQRPATEEEIRRYCEAEIVELNQTLNEINEERDQKFMEALAQLRGVIEADILLHQLRLDENFRDIPFILYLQLTISTIRSDGVEILSIERMKYTRSLGAATKYLIKRLLNKPMNYVTRIIISPWSNIDCYWLPTEMKLAARYLIICNYHELVMRTVGQFLRHINQRPFETIAFHLLDAPKRYHYYIHLINYLVFRAAPVGTHYTAHTSLTQGYIICNKMKELEGLTAVGTPTRRCQWLPDCVILPLPNDAQLEFYMTPVVDHPFTVLLNFEIQPRNN